MQKYYMCHSWLTWDGWTWVKASSPALAALEYYDNLAQSFKHYKEVYVYEAGESPMVDTPRKFYIPDNTDRSGAGKELLSHVI